MLIPSFVHLLIILTNILPLQIFYSPSIAVTEFSFAYICGAITQVDVDCFHLIYLVI